MSKNFFKSKIFITLTTILTLTIIAFSTLFYLNNQAFDEQKIQKTVEDKFLGKYNEYGNYKDINFYNSRQPTLIQTKYDLFKPVYSLILNDCVYSNPQKPIDQCNQFTLFIFYLERINLLDFKIIDYKKLDVHNSSFSKIQESAKKQDLSKIKSDNGQDFAVVDPYSPSQIQSQQQNQNLTDLRSTTEYFILIDKLNEPIQKIIDDKNSSVSLDEVIASTQKFLDTFYNPDIQQKMDKFQQADTKGETYQESNILGLTLTTENINRDIYNSQIRVNYKFLINGYSTIKDKRMPRLQKCKQMGLITAYDCYITKVYQNGDF